MVDCWSLVVGRWLLVVGVFVGWLVGRLVGGLMIRLVDWSVG